MLISAKSTAAITSAPIAATSSFPIPHMRITPAAPKPPPAPQAKPVPYAARNTAFSITHGASGHPPATAHTSATARTATKLILQAVPVAQQPAPPKRSVRRVVGNTAKKTQITMLWCIPMQKPPPVRNPAGTLTTSASAAAIPPAKNCPHSMILCTTKQNPPPVRKSALLPLPAGAAAISKIWCCPH